MSARDFFAISSFVFVMGSLLFFLSTWGVKGEREACDSLCARSHLAGVYLPRTRACFCAGPDGSLRLPPDGHVESTEGQ